METKTNNFARSGIWGVFLIIFGTWWGLSELGLVAFSWSAIGPLAIVIVGVSMLLGWTGWCGGKDE